MAECVPVARWLPAALLCAAAALAPAPAGGFEADGYRSGMTLAEVQRLSGPLQPAGRPPGERADYYIGRAPGGSGAANAIFVFCQDRLFAFQLGLGGSPAFAQAVAAETQRRGPGNYRAEHVQMPDGPLGVLRFDWPDAGGRFVLTLMTSERRTSGTRRWEASTVPCR